MIKEPDNIPASRGATLLRQQTRALCSGNTEGVLCASQAIVAKCTDCMGWFVDGRHDCDVTDCPLYPWMPYRGKPIKDEKGAR